jgi:hypothetical protein
MTICITIFSAKLNNATPNISIVRIKEHIQCSLVSDYDQCYHAERHMWVSYAECCYTKCCFTGEAATHQIRNSTNAFVGGTSLCLLERRQLIENVQSFYVQLMNFSSDESGITQYLCITHIHRNYQCVWTFQNSFQIFSITSRTGDMSIHSLANWLSFLGATWKVASIIFTSYFCSGSFKFPLLGGTCKVASKFQPSFTSFPPSPNVAARWSPSNSAMGAL